MANLVVSLIMVAVILTVMGALAQGSLGPQSNLSDSWKAMRQSTGEIARTRMASLGVSVQDGGATVEFTIRSDGQTQLRDFGRWDVIVAYYETPGSTDLVVSRLVYTSSASPAAGEWTVKGIYLIASTEQPEVFNRGIVDTGEEVVIRASVDPAIAEGTQNLITVAGANGVTISATFPH